MSLAGTRCYGVSLGSGKQRDPDYVRVRYRQWAVEDDRDGNGEHAMECATEVEFLVAVWRGYSAQLRRSPKARGL